MAQSSNSSPSLVRPNYLEGLQNVLMENGDSFSKYSSSALTEIAKTDDGKNVASFKILNHGFALKYQFSFTEKGEVAALLAEPSEKSLDASLLKDVFDFVLSQSVAANKAKELEEAKVGEKSGAIDQSEQEKIQAEKVKALEKEKQRNARKIKREAQNAKKIEAQNAKNLKGILSEIDEEIAENLSLSNTSATYNIYSLL
jgi:hypothetical protein